MPAGSLRAGCGNIPQSLKPLPHASLAGACRLLLKSSWKKTLHLAARMRDSQPISTITCRSVRALASARAPCKNTHHQQVLDKCSRDAGRSPVQSHACQASWCMCPTQGVGHMPTRCHGNARQAQHHAHVAWTQQRLVGIPSTPL